MFCPHCGSSLSDNSKFCSKCGTAVPHINASSAISKTTKRKSILPIALGFIVCVLFAVVCYIKIKPVFTRENANDNILYLSNGTYEFLSSPDAEQSVPLNDSRGYGGDDLVKFSPDGKYIYFYTDVQDYNTSDNWHRGNLFRAECSDLINHPKDEPQITEVAHDIIISDWQ